MPGNAVPMIRPLDFFYIAPEIVLTAWGLLVLIADFAFYRKSDGPARRKALGILTLAGVGLTLVVAALALPGMADAFGLTALGDRVYNDPDPFLFFGAIAADAAARWINIILIALLGMVVAMSMAWDFTEHWGEFYSLLLWAAVGMMLLAAAEELLTLFLTLETMTLCLYLATSFEKSRRRSAEGGLKYFVYGSVSSALFLFGLSYIYGLTGTTRIDAIAMVLSQGGTIGLGGNIAGAVAILLILVGFGFKVAAVPFHQWAPDAYEGAPAPAAAWIASGSKVASFVAMLKVLVHALGPWAQASDSTSSPGWIGLLAVVAGASMTFGNLAALAQRNLKRMLAYSSVAHAGYILVGVLAAAVSREGHGAAGAVLYYLVVYGFTTIAAFALAAWLVKDKQTDEIDDLNGLGFRSPILAVCILLLMLSLIGMPPLAGFFGKLYMFMEAIHVRQQGLPTLTWLVALGLINSVISAFYYVRVLKAMFLRPAKGVPSREAPLSLSLPILFGTLVAVGFGIFPSSLLETMRGAAIPMLSASASAPAQGTDSRYTTQADPSITPEILAKRQAERAKMIGSRIQGMGGAPAGGQSPSLDTEEGRRRYNQMMMNAGAGSGARMGDGPRMPTKGAATKGAATKDAPTKGAAPKKAATGPMP